MFELAPPSTQTPLQDAFEAKDRGGMSDMDVGKMVDVAIKGLEQDRYEIRPGLSNTLKLMSRVAPNFMLKQTSRTIDIMLNKTTD